MAEDQTKEKLVPIYFKESDVSKIALWDDEKSEYVRLESTKYCCFETWPGGPVVCYCLPSSYPCVGGPCP